MKIRCLGRNSRKSNGPWALSRYSNRCEICFRPERLWTKTTQLWPQDDFLSTHKSARPFAQCVATLQHCTHREAPGEGSCRAGTVPTGGTREPRVSAWDGTRLNTLSRVAQTCRPRRKPRRGCEIDKPPAEGAITQTSMEQRSCHERRRMPGIHVMSWSCCAAGSSGISHSAWFQSSKNIRAGWLKPRTASPILGIYFASGTSPDQGGSVRPQ